MAANGSMPPIGVQPDVDVNTRIERVMPKGSLPAPATNGDAGSPAAGAARGAPTETDAAAAAHAAATPAAPDDRGAAVRRSYDRIAAAYAAELFGELAGKPLDRAVLDAFAEQVLAAGLGPVADVGCGPGQIAHYLADRGVPVVGVDLSPGMVATARRLNPGIPFGRGDLLALDAADGAWGGVVAFYAIVHLTPDEVSRALAEFRRALRPGGLLLLAFHVGEEVVHRDELWGEPVDLDFRFFATAEIERRLTDTGFVVEARIERRPYPGAEHPSRRAYLLARKPAAG